MNIKDISKQKSSSILNYYKSSSFFQKNQHIGGNLRTLLKDCETFHDIKHVNQFIEPQKNIAKKNSLKPFLIKGSQQKSNSFKLLFQKQPKTCIKVQKCSLSPIKRKQNKKNLSLQNGSKSQIYKAQRKNIDNKMFSSTVSQYNQNNVYNLLKKMKSHKQKMKRQAFIVEQKRQNFKLNEQFVLINQMQDQNLKQTESKNIFINLFPQQNNNDFYSSKKQVKKQQIQRIQAKLTGKTKYIYTDQSALKKKKKQNSIESPINRVNQELKNKMNYQTETISRYKGVNQFIQLQEKYTQSHKNEGLNSSAEKTQNIQFCSSFQLKQYLIQCYRTSNQTIYQIKQEIKNQIKIIQEKVQTFGSILRQNLYNLVEEHIMNWKHHQKQTLVSYAKDNIILMQQLKDQLTGKCSLLNECVKRLNQQESQSIFKKQKYFYKKQMVNKSQNFPDVYKQVFKKTLGSEVQIYIDQIQLRVKQVFQSFKNNEVKQKETYSEFLNKQLQKQLVLFKNYYQTMNNQNIQQSALNKIKCHQKMKQQSNYAVLQ